MSTIPPDHATTVEPMLSRKVEVLRGPSTLLYGGGAIGGVVNVLDNKIPTRMPDRPVEGFVSARGHTVADEQAGAVGLTARAGAHTATPVVRAPPDADNYDVTGLTDPASARTPHAPPHASAGPPWHHDRA